MVRSPSTIRAAMITVSGSSSRFQVRAPERAEEAVGGSGGTDGAVPHLSVRGGLAQFLRRREAPGQGDASRELDGRGRPLSDPGPAGTSPSCGSRSFSIGLGVFTATSHAPAPRLWAPERRASTLLRTMESDATLLSTEPIGHSLDRHA